MARMVEVTLPGVARNLVLSFMKPLLVFCLFSVKEASNFAKIHEETTANPALSQLQLGSASKVPREPYKTLGCPQTSFAATM